MYSELYLRLEPIGLERVAASIRDAGHDVRLLDLQIFSHADYRAELAAFQYQTALEKGDKKIVGVNCHTDHLGGNLETLRIGSEVA